MCLSNNFNGVGEVENAARSRKNQTDDTTSQENSHQGDSLSSQTTQVQFRIRRRTRRK